MSLETRLTSYDWDTNFATFQRVTQKGSFRPLCLNAKGTELQVSLMLTTSFFHTKPLTNLYYYFLQGTRDLDGFSPNISKVWRAPPTCSFKYGNKKSLYTQRNRYVTESENFDSTSYSISNDSDVLEADDDSNNVIQIAARSKTSRSFDPNMAAASGALASFHSTSLLSHQLLLIVTAVIVGVSCLSDVTLSYHRLRQRLSA